MRWQTGGFIPVLIFCILIRPSTSSSKSIVSSLDSLEEVDAALQHAQKSLDDLTDLVFEVFTTESPTEAPTSDLTTLDMETSGTASSETMTPTSGETETPETEMPTSEPYNPTTTESEITTTADPETTPKAQQTTDQQTDVPTESPTDSVESSTDVNLSDSDDASSDDRLYGENHGKSLSSSKRIPLHFLADMLARILPHELSVAREIDQYSGISEETTEEPDVSGSRTEENTSYTDEVTGTESEISTETSAITQETTTKLPTTTLGPWGDRVYGVLGDMKQVTTEISDGQVDHEHAYRLDQLSIKLDNLVAEGVNDTSVLEGMSQEDLDYLNSVKNLTSYTRQDIKKQISKAKDDKQELIIAITLLSVLFVLVLVGLIVAMIRPWAGGCRLPGSRKRMRNAHEDASYISNASFQDRSQQMRLNERRNQEQDFAV